jgi:hypothetical protein
MTKKKTQKVRTVGVFSDSDLAFDPVSLIETSISSGFDSSLMGEIDERQLSWAPNIAAWIMEPEFLGIKTIYPHQLQMLLRLHGDVCPWCSDWEFYTVDVPVDVKVPDFLDRIQLVVDGKCPKCGRTRLDQYKEGYWLFPHELDLLWGMRCIPKSSWVYTKRGLLQAKDVNEGDTLTHGPVVKKIDSGVLPSLMITTEYNWTLVGARETHIVPTLNKDLELEYKLLKDCTVGELLILHSPNLWPEQRHQLPLFTRKKLDHGHQAKDFIFPTEVTPELARLIGYLISNGQYTREYNLRIMSSDPDIDEDIKRCCLSVFGEEPKLEECRECKTTPFCKCWTLNGVAVMEWLKLIGLNPNIAHDKYIPDFILQSPKEVVCDFLAGLFGGDGGVHHETAASTKILLYYTTVSKKLMEQLRLILLNLGIVTRCSKLNGAKVGYTISTKNSDFIKVFKDNVRLASKEKTDVLKLSKPKGRTRYVTPQGFYTAASRKKWPDKLKRLVSDGYFFVKIIDIQDGEPLEMMDVQIPDTNIYTADGFVHHNSGKSAIAGMEGSYVLHRYLRIPDPASYFGLLKGSLLVMRFVALTAGQASETIWGQFQRSVDNCTWFHQYHDFLKHYETKYGMELHKWLNTVFHYPLKGIFGYFLGASIDRSRGRTAIFSAFDEIGWWLGQKDGKLGNADETYAAYEKASRTIRNAAMPRFLGGDFNIPTAIIAAVSSTSSKDDYMMRLIRGAKLDRKKVWSHKASWEVNPDFAANPDELRDERETNYKTYMRDYGSIPPYANNPFIENEELVMRNAILDRTVWPVSQEAGKIGVYLDAERVEKNQTIPYCLAMDLAFNHCGYSAALLKLKEEDFSVVQVAGLFSIYPDKNQVIDLSQTFENFVKKMCDRVPIRLVVFDQWQSKTQIQSLQNMNVKAQDFSLTYGNFDYFRTQLYQGKIEFVKPEMDLEDVDSAVILEDVLYPRPHLHLLWQLLSVSEVGNKIGKGEGHDDLFRSVVLGSTFLWNEEWRPQFEYRGGMTTLSAYRKGRLSLASASYSTGQSYTVNTNVTPTTAFGNNKRALGAILPRGTGSSSI